MQSRLTGLGLFLKWVLAPALLALIGYYLVGPSIGRIKPAEKSSGPQIDIDVSPK
ncbi:MAG TPA: hypothetical protein VK934_08085 [Fimbriimonas sp.]|nr:hypothetical protein [Fimbriimonas sp.]